MLLSAIGIIMVVDSHCFSPLNLFNSFFPYHSFFMPMFVFISGYFNKVNDSTKLKEYIRKKENSLILPYILIVISTLLLEKLFDWINTGIFPSLSIDELLFLLIEPFTTGSPVMISGPIWFIPSLCSVLLVYAVIKKLLYKHWNNYLAFTVFSVMHIGVVWYAQSVEVNLFLLLPLKCLFFLPFLELGIIYREKLEPKLSNLRSETKLIILICLFLINSLRMMILPDPEDIVFINIARLSGFTSPYPVTPFISSIIGILFWLTLVDMLGKVIYENRVMNYISENTYMIMGFHLFFFYLLSFVLCIIHTHIVPLPGFDVDSFYKAIFYVWDYHVPFRFVYLLSGVAGPLLIKLLIDKVKQRFNTPSCR